MRSHEVTPESRPTIADWLQSHGLDGWMISTNGEIVVEWYGGDPMVYLPLMRLVDFTDLAALDEALRNTPDVMFTQ